MTYEEFIEQLKKQANEELGYPMEGMKFYPEGFTSDNRFCENCKGRQHDG